MKHGDINGCMLAITQILERNTLPPESVYPHPVNVSESIVFVNRNLFDNEELREALETFVKQHKFTIKPSKKDGFWEII